MSDQEVINRYRMDAVANTKSVSSVSYSYFFKMVRELVQARENAMFELLEGIIKPQYIDEMKILDVGCGNGNVIRDFIKYGATPSLIHGIDLIPERIWEAKDKTPNVKFVCGSAVALPYLNKTFDIAICFTLFSSILDDGVRQRIAEEILRVMNIGGLILYFDVNEKTVGNETRGLSIDEVKKLFGGTVTHKEIDYDSHTLNMALVRT